MSIPKLSITRREREMTNSNKSKLSRAIYVLCALFAVSSVMLIIYYIGFPSGAEFHSDFTDTLYWAEATVSSGKLFNPDFSYAALLPFGGSLLMLPFVAVFGATSVAHIIGMILFAVIFLCSIFLMFRRMGVSESMCFATVGITALVLCSSAKLREIFWGHIIYYSLSVFFIFVMLTLVMRIFDKPSLKKSCGSLAALFIFAFLVGFDGLQLIVVSVFPVLFAVAGERFLDGKNKLFCSKNTCAILIFSGVAFFALAGAASLNIASGDVTAGYENAYSSYSAMSEWLNHILGLPVQWYSLFGIDIADHDALFNIDSILNIVLLISSTLLGVVPVIALFFYKHFTKKEKLLLLAHWGLTIAIFFGYIFGFLAAANWRLSPVLCSCIVVCMLCISRAITSKKLVAKRFAALALCALLATSALSVYRISEMPMNGKAENSNYKISKMLSDNSLEYGFATFWYSQSITVLSNQNVKTRCIDVTETGGVTPRTYQQQLQWYEPQSDVDEYFILLSLSEMMTLDKIGEFDELSEKASRKLVFDNYYVLVFPMSSPMPW